MPRSRQANILALPVQTQANALHIAAQGPLEAEHPPVMDSPRLRFLSFPHPASSSHLAFIVPHDLVRWGSVLAGLLIAVVTSIALSLLGLTIGVIALPPNGDTVAANVTYYASLIMIWEAGSMVLSVFLGGFVAARSAASGGRGAGFLNGVLVFLFGVVLSIGLISVGTGLLFNALGTNPVNVYVYAVSALNNPDATNTGVTYLKPLIIGALASLIVGVAASGLGGLAGHHKVTNA